MSKTFEVTCPHCNETFLVETPIPEKRRGQLYGIALEDMTDEQLKREIINAIPFCTRPSSAAPPRTSSPRTRPVWMPPRLRRRSATPLPSLRRPLSPPAMRPSTLRPSLRSDPLPPCLAN